MRRLIPKESLSLVAEQDTEFDDVLLEDGVHDVDLVARHVVEVELV